MSNLLHKVKDAVTHGSHDKQSSSTNAGPHDSNLANKGDPRVDSDRDHRGAYTAAGTGTGTGRGSYNDTSGTGRAGYNDTSGTGRGSYNDSTAGSNTNTTPYGAGPGLATGAGNTGYGTGTTTSGPHSSNIANKADSRVDSERGQYGTTGGVTTRSGYSTNPNSTNAGPHGSNLANKVDPRIDSDLDNRARHQNLGGNAAPAGSSYATPGSGNAQQTAGPYDKNIANKLDPRVDSDLGSSRNVGANATRY